jgi:hypothetical protein
MARRLNAAIVAALVVVAIVLLPVWRATDHATGVPNGVLTDAPGGITAALRTNARPSDRLFNPQPWGSWFEFALPELPVAIDSRIELFPVETWQDYETVASASDGWQGIVNRWGITLMLVPNGDALANELKTNGWQRMYDDIDGSLYTSPGR